MRSRISGELSDPRYSCVVLTTTRTLAEHDSESNTIYSTNAWTTLLLSSVPPPFLLHTYTHTHILPLVILSMMGFNKILFFLHKGFYLSSTGIKRITFNILRKLTVTTSTLNHINSRLSGIIQFINISFITIGLCSNC